MGMVLMIPDNLVGKALEVSDAFAEAAYDSVQAFKDALRQAFPQLETVVASMEDLRKVKELRFYQTLSIIDPETGGRDPPELYVQRARWFRQYLPETLHLRLAYLFLAGLHDQQLVYTIKATIPLGQLTFESVVDRFQRRCGTESPAITTLRQGEDGKEVRFGEEEKKHQEREKVYEDEEKCEGDVNSESEEGRMNDECEESSVCVVAVWLS
jgi:hypothetical protein